MSRVPRPAKIAQWNERLDRFDSKKQTVAQFCAEEGVSATSFYQWKKRLQVKFRGRVASARSTPKQVFKSVELMSAPLSPSQRTTIRWTDGVEIELGNDLPVVDRILQTLVSLRSSTPQPEGRPC